MTESGLIQGVAKAVS